MTRKLFLFGRWLSVALACNLVHSIAFGSIAASEPPPSRDLDRTVDTSIARSTTPAMRQIENANTRLGLQVFSTVARDRPTENAAFSPTSLSVLLGLLYRGARSQTQTDMAFALGYAGLTPEEVDGYYDTLLTSFEALDSDYTLDLANAVWGQEGEAFDPTFLEIARTVYRATLESIDFQQITIAVEQINDWAAAATQNRIQNLLTPRDLDPPPVVVLTNALYFLGGWTLPFDEDKTEQRSFALADGGQIEHPMMFQKNMFRSLQTDLFQAIELPYGDSERIVMYAFLPHENKTLADFYRQLTLENWNAWLESFDSQYSRAIVVGFPRFRLDSDAQLNEALQSAGLESIFRNDADFSNIVSDGFWIDLVKQKTYVEVNERGTEAAAVTAIIGTRAAPQEIVFDRPFFFAICDTETNAILFLGTVVNPRS
ncbi:serpin family protein [Baaleninema simplex]|uniref:serpin family protein n=1 Tax=Baaleninema simplex TaxID=2862350 RepID=UPI000380B229|nr:serpin family protein [Baaleninema simplex]